MKIVFYSKHVLFINIHCLYCISYPIHRGAQNQGIIKGLTIMFSALWVFKEAIFMILNAYATA